MKRITLCIAIIALVYLNTSAQSSYPDPHEFYFLTSKSKVKYGVFKFNPKYDQDMFDKHSRPATLSAAELEKLELLIDAGISDHNKRQKGQVITEPAKYVKQLMPVVDSRGEKEVWVNCSCQVSRVFHKGICSFYLKINLTKGTVIKFAING